MILPPRVVNTPRVREFVVTAVVLLTGGALYFAWDNWWVNWDGGFYLYMARSLGEAGRLLFPDGSPAMFRGPGYPGLFAAGWTVLDVSAKTAIWMSRAVLLVGGGLVTFAVAKKASATGAVFAGLVAVIPALVLESGAWYFVPDGLAAVLVLGSIAGVVLTRTTPGSLSGLLAGMVMAAAVLTKETALLYAPIVPLVIWSRTSKGDPFGFRAVGWYVLSVSAVLGAWLWWSLGVSDAGAPWFLPVSVDLASLFLGLALLAGGTLVKAANWLSRRIGEPSTWGVAAAGFVPAVLSAALLLRLVGEPTVMSATAGLSALGAELVIFLGWAWVPALMAIAVAAFLGRRISRTASSLWLAGVLLFAVGLGQMWYAASAALSLRNGVGAVIGLAIIIGTSLWASRVTIVRLLMVGTVGAFLVLAGLVTAEINSTRNVAAQSWDNAAVYELLSWLRDDSPSATLKTTPVFATYLYFLEPSLPEPALLEWHFTGRRAEDYERGDFCQQIWWAADLSDCPRSAEFRVAQGNRRITSALFAEDAPTEGVPLVVTGNTRSGSAFNGTGLLYLIEKYDLGDHLFATSGSHLPNWAVVYDLDWDRWNSESLPAVVQPNLTGLDGLTDEIIPIGHDEFLTLLHGVLPP